MRPLPLSEIPTLPLLYKLQHLVPTDTQSEYKPDARINEIVSLIRHDITSVAVSAIVNAANRSLLGGGGVDGAIHARAGPDLKKECRTLGGCETGSAKITDAYELPCEKVIHAVGPIYSVERRKDDDAPAQLLRGCYETALRLAVENKCTSIAFSCISTGVYGYPSHLAAQEVVEFVRNWLEAHKEDDFGGIQRIVFCCFERKDEDAYQEVIPLYFPDTGIKGQSAEKDLEQAADLEKALPDPPNGDILEEGQPESKKQKTSDVDEDEEWEEVEKVEQSATNGVEEVSKNQEVPAATTKAVFERKTENGHETGSTEPVHGLQKDW